MGNLYKRPLKQRCLQLLMCSKKRKHTLHQPQQVNTITGCARFTALVLKDLQYSTALSLLLLGRIPILSFFYNPPPYILLASSPFFLIFFKKFVFLFFLSFNLIRPRNRLVEKLFLSSGSQK